MATSAFKSKTKRASIGGSSSEDTTTASRSLRRSRSLSRFSRPIPPEPGTEPDYIRNATNGKFVNTVRGSTAAFPEISLDDLALEFFSSSSINENESDGGAVKRNGREGRSVSRRVEVGRWASDTASSRRRGRSVSRTRGNVASISSTAAAKHAVSSDAGSRRRRSLSVARYQISDSESEVDHSRYSVNRASVMKASMNGSGQLSLAPKATASSNRRLGRSRSRKDLSSLHDGYSSHSSALTDDESKDTRLGKNGYEKIIRAVYSQKKAVHPVEDVPNGGIYETMRKELRHAVQEIRTELNQAMGRNHTTSTSIDCSQSDYCNPLQDFCGKNTNYAKNLEQESRGRVSSKIGKEKSDLRSSTTAMKPTRTRKRSSDRNGMPNRLTEEAEKYIEEFISNLEDTDISSFDGERSDTSSTLGGMTKARVPPSIRDVETFKSPMESISRPIEMDGIILPWLQWEISHDGSPPGKKKTQTPVTPKALEWDTEKDLDSVHDPVSHSTSSRGSWSPYFFSSPMDKRGSSGNRLVGELITRIDMDEYLNVKNDEEVLFDMFMERNRIHSGGLLLCTGFL